MQTMTVTITQDGSLRFLVDADTQPFLTGDALVRRASHVEPAHATLRLLFHSLRRMFGEYGMLANFTRVWPCLWRVNLAPTGGPILPKLYTNRQSAIAAEVEYLNENFI